MEDILQMLPVEAREDMMRRKKHWTGNSGCIC